MASSFPPDNNDNNNQAAEQHSRSNNNNTNNSNTRTVATTNDDNTATNGNTNNNNNINEDAVEPRRQVQVVQHQAANNPINTTTSLLPLDWTQMGTGEQQQQQAPLPVRYPGDVAEILPDETEICIVGTAGQKITVMGANFSDTVNNEHLTQLILRSHLIRKMEGLEKFHNLELLELYDNQIDELTCLNNNGNGDGGGDGGTPGKTLRVLDMSYNVIRDMLPVKFCPNLQELYLANNKLKTIAGLSNLKQLKKLDLGANRIRVMDATELDGLTNLEELWLGKNKIEKIDGLSKLVKLRRLDVQSNRLTTIEHLDTIAPNLEELYLAHNGITNEGAEHGLSNLSFPNLSVLDLSRNRLTTTTMFSHLTSLDELWLSGNKIAEFANISCLSAIDNLDTIYLEYNPIAEDPLYRKRIKELLPSLSQIDATMIASVASVTGIPSSTTTTTAATTQDVQQLQEMAVQRAKEETEQASAGGGGAKK